MPEKMIQVSVGDLFGYSMGDPPSKRFVENVRKRGLLVPIRVRMSRTIDSGHDYEVIDGRRRVAAAKIIGLKTLPAIIEGQDQEQAVDLYQSLSANYSRSENVIGDARTVWALMDSGVTEKEIAAESGMALVKVRQLRDIRKLDPELIDAVEAGTMNAWAAWNAARLPQEFQNQLKDILQEKGKITADDVVSVRQVRKDAAKADLPSSMFDVPELKSVDIEYPADAKYNMATGESMDGGYPSDELDESQDANSEPSRDDYPKKVSDLIRSTLPAHERRKTANKYLWYARHELMTIKSSRRTDADKALIAAIDAYGESLDD